MIPNAVHPVAECWTLHNCHGILRYWALYRRTKIPAIGKKSDEYSVKPENLQIMGKASLKSS